LDETAAKIRTTSPGTDAFVQTADITNQDQVQSAIDAAIKHFDGTVPNVLVNNAGGLRGFGSLIDVDINDFWQAFELNIKGPLMVSQTFLRSVREHSSLQESLTIINIPSGAVHVPYLPGAGAYGSSKMAMSKITEYLHHENPNWFVINMQPGVVATELARLAGRQAPDAPELPAGMGVWLATQPEKREEVRRVLNGKFLWAYWDVDEMLQKGEEIERRDLLTLGLKGWAEDFNAEELSGGFCLGTRMLRRRRSKV
jgi:NAD(P)-dependent dehydrogenase (short-subunit alcohol dehydrogenase family)